VESRFFSFFLPVDARIRICANITGPDSAGPKTYGSYESGTLVKTRPFSDGIKL
jgi:hypothetical protein